MLFYGHRYAKKNIIIKRNASKKIKEPFLVLVNHSSMQDFKVCSTALYPNPINYIAAYNQLIKREKLMRSLGAFPKRQFSTDVKLVREIMHIFKRKGALVIFPEAKLSADGTCGIFPPSIAKLIKIAGVKVFNLHISGNYVDKPKWAKQKRGCKARAELAPLLSVEEVRTLSANDIFSIVKEALSYDDFKWQRENKIKVTSAHLTDGLHDILYFCPACKIEGEMTSGGVSLSCRGCGKTWTMDDYGVLKAIKGETEFDNIHDWYECQRQNVKDEILKGKYYYETDCKLQLLPDFKGYVDGGKGKLVHDGKGFSYTGVFNEKEVNFFFPSTAFYTIPFECGSSFDLATETQTYRILPNNPSLLAKINLATEEFFKLQT